MVFLFQPGLGIVGGDLLESLRDLLVSGTPQTRHLTPLLQLSFQSAWKHKPNKVAGELGS